jgi:hypothetical protein
LELAHFRFEKGELVMSHRTDEDANRASVAYSAISHPVSHEDGGLPCIKVAGVTAFVYRENGKVVVSIDTDEANGDTPLYGERGAERVGLTVSVNGHEIFDDPPEADLRQLRKTGMA